MRALFMAVCLATLSLSTAQPVFAQQPGATAVEDAISTDELMHALALDRVFIRFGSAIEAAPRQQGVAFNAVLRGAWIRAARQVFVPAQMHRHLARLIDNKFTAEDNIAFSRFYGSEFGRRVSAADRAVSDLTPDAQLAARDAGARIGEQASAARHDQITEVLSLIGGDLSHRLARESLRSMLIGMSLANRQQADMVFPWEELEYQLDAIMPQIAAEISESQRAIAFFTYRDFTDEDFGDLLAFLRTEPARKLYTVVVYAVGEVITERMNAFGDSLAAHLARVNI